MTWGSLRLVLATASPSVSLDLLDSWLLERYESVLEATDWSGLKTHVTIQSQAAYQSVLDTVTLTVGSTTVTGLGTAWTAALGGQRFYRPGDTVIYTVSFVDPLTLMLDRPYEGTGADTPGTIRAASPYVLMQNVYPLPNDVRSIVTVLNPISGRPMGPFSKDGLDMSVGSRSLIGDPQSWAPCDDTPESKPPVIKQIEFYPPPRYARGFVIEYERAALGFDGENTAGEPLPFISSAVLLAGVRADIATHLEKFQQAVKYEAAFERELGRLLLVEHSQRRVHTALKMAPRFNRHRMGRAMRNFQRGWGQGQGSSN